MNSDSRISNRITDFFWRVPCIDIFINQDEKTVWFDFDLRLSPFYLFFFMLISTHWMRCENWCCCLLTLFFSLEKQSNVKRGRSPYCKHTRTYICACLCTLLSICFDVQRKSQNVCRHQTLENDEETKRKTMNILSIRASKDTFCSSSSLHTYSSSKCSTTWPTIDRDRLFLKNKIKKTPFFFLLL